MQTTPINCDPAGNLCAVGFGQLQGSSSTFALWLIAKSVDHGATWTMSDAYQLAAEKSSNARFLATDSFGDVYAGGYAWGPVVPSGLLGLHWTVRKRVTP